MLIGLLLATALSVEDALGASGVTADIRADSVRQFPRVEGTNLEGRRFVLPADFEADYNVVFIAFRREQQGDVDSWLPFLREQKLSERGIRIYELPTLSRGYRLMRGFIDGGMRRGIPEKATREATITLYIDKSPFMRALLISTDERIVTLVVARDGRVLWRADGPFAPSTGTALIRALDTLKPGQTTPG